MKHYVLRVSGQGLSTIGPIADPFPDFPSAKKCAEQKAAQYPQQRFVVLAESEVVCVTPRVTAQLRAVS